jgi:hypothetical protein
MSFREGTGKYAHETTMSAACSQKNSKESFHILMRNHVVEHCVER